METNTNYHEPGLGEPPALLMGPLGARCSFVDSQSWTGAQAVSSLMIHSTLSWQGYCFKKTLPDARYVMQIQRKIPQLEQELGGGPNALGGPCDPAGGPPLPPLPLPSPQTCWQPKLVKKQHVKASPCGRLRGRRSLPRAVSPGPGAGAVSRLPARPAWCFVSRLVETQRLRAKFACLVHKPQDS